MNIIEKVWGWEVVLVSSKLYSCKLMVIKGDYQCSIHSHKLKDETFVLLLGAVALTIAGEREYMAHLHEYHIPPNTKHTFAGLAKFSFVLEVATEDQSKDSYRETKSGRITNDNK